MTSLRAAVADWLGRRLQRFGILRGIMVLAAALMVVGLMAAGVVLSGLAPCGAAGLAGGGFPGQPRFVIWAPFLVPPWRREHPALVRAQLAARQALRLFGAGDVKTALPLIRAV